MPDILSDTTMAEPATPTLLLLAEEHYSHVALILNVHGFSCISASETVAALRREHVRWRSRPHPPGPTPEWLTLNSLIEEGIITPAAIRLTDASQQSFDVEIIEQSDPSAPCRLIPGFATREMARDYARTVLARSLQDCVSPDDTHADAQKKWSLWGDDARIKGDNYLASEDLPLILEKHLNRKPNELGADSPTQRFTG
jgi:hypothetical protein